MGNWTAPLGQQRAGMRRFIYWDVWMRTLRRQGWSSNWSDVEIEHLYPQSPEEHWKGVHFSKPKLTRYALGNLALLPAETNRECSNLSWQHKKEKYAFNNQRETVQFSLTILAMKFDLWTDEQFNTRHQEMLKNAGENLRATRLLANCWEVRRCRGHSGSGQGVGGKGVQDCH